MLRNRLYYRIKPLLPARLRLLMRRIHARRIYRQCGEVWPISPSAGGKPDGWPGWPEGRRFAFVLTHDVESQRGLDRVRELAELEMRLGFRSSFNFVPEGEYRVPEDLRAWLVRHGFEVGVHDLNHDGKLYESETEFAKKAERINQYLASWGAVGFRSGFMLRNLQRLQALNIEYDASTFDTDPFEPQPDGVDTIFPFWVPAATGQQEHETTGPLDDGTTRQSVVSGQWSRGPVVSGPESAVSGQWSAVRGPVVSSPVVCSPVRSGYIELPYTLPQDSTLFLVLRERSIGIWKRKLDWVAIHGGMVLLDTHPDYMTFGQSDKPWSHYPATYYAELLEYLRTKYKGDYCQALPREVADYCTTFKPKLAASEALSLSANATVVRFVHKANQNQAVC